MSPINWEDAAKIMNWKKIFSLEELHSAYRAAAKIKHPDMGGSSAEMAELNDIYKILLKHLYHLTSISNAEITHKEPCDIEKKTQERSQKAHCGKLTERKKFRFPYRFALFLLTAFGSYYATRIIGVTKGNVWLYYGILWLVIVNLFIPFVTNPIKHLTERRLNNG